MSLRSLGMNKKIFHVISELSPHLLLKKTDNTDIIVKERIQTFTATRSNVIFIYLLTNCGVHLDGLTLRAH